MNKLRNIPGTVKVVGREFRFISDDGSNDFDLLFDKLFTQLEQPIAQNGGVISENCMLWLPTGELFHGLSYKGDILGWREDLKLSSDRMRLIIGIINDTQIELSDNRIYTLSECKINCY